MKFIVEREDLLKPLQRIINLLTNRPILPILSNLLLKVDNDTLFLTGSNLEMEMIAYIRLFSPHEQGEITAPARKLFDICRNFPSGAKIVVQLEGNRVLVCSGRSRFLLSTLLADDFPNIEDWESEIEFHLPQLKMKHLIEATQFAMANQDVRHYLNGMLFETNGKEIRTVATDGHRLAICFTTIEIELPKYSLIVPRRGIIELMRMLDSDIDTSVYVQIGKNNIRVHFGYCIFTSKLIDSQFPDYRHVFPKNPNKILEASCDVLKHAFTRVSILSNEKFRGVRLQAQNNQIKIVANNYDQEEAEEIIDVNYKGTAIEIGFNVGYILDVLNVLKCENVRILLTDSVSSVQIEDSTSQKSATYIVMPIRL